jgi:hypothetical protein
VVASKQEFSSNLENLHLLKTLANDGAGLAFSGAREKTKSFMADPNSGDMPHGAIEAARYLDRATDAEADLKSKLLKFYAIYDHLKIAAILQSKPSGSVSRCHEVFAYDSLSRLL